MPARLRGLSGWRSFLIPEGRPLPEPTWRRRHRGILVLLWAHVPGLALFGILAGAQPSDVLIEAGVVAILAMLGGLTSRRRTLAAAMACLGLLSSSALLVHLSGGYIEMHFHFFVMVGLMTLYQEWVPFLLAVGYVVVHHGLVGVLHPVSVFNHPAAWGNPWGWAAIHGTFILGMSLVSLIVWRLHETGHAQAEAALRESERRYRLLAENVTDVIWVRDMTLKPVYISPSVQRLRGYTPEEAMAQRLDEALTPASMSVAMKALADALALEREGRADTERTFTLDLEACCADGSTVWTEATMTFMRDGGGRPTGIIGVSRDVTQRKRADAALRESERRFRSVTESAPDAIVAADAHGAIVSWNRGAEAMFGYTEAEVLGQSLTVLMPERYHEPHRRGLARAGATGKSVVGLTREFSGLRKDGTEFPLELSLGSWESGQGRFYVGVIRDLTERKRAEEALRVTEEQLRQAQKMDVVGRLAGGIAHDFNNLLTVILGRSELLLGRDEWDSESRRDVELISGTAARAGALTKQLLAFSRKQVLQPKILDLNEIVAGMATMLRRLIGEDVDLATALQRPLGLVRVDRTQIEQVIVNLVVNARDAMPRGGTLTIETGEDSLDGAFATRNPGVSPGRHVVLTVRDTGSGMDPTVRARLFEPFFTTKGPGKGTGLGLATVYGIVKQHEGCILVDSAVGAGTTFRIYLRQVGTAGAADEAAPAAPRPGNETILLVEDEVGVRDLAAEILRLNGYTVLAPSPDEALAVAERYAGPIHLLLTDVTMPGLNGRELADRLTRVCPQAKVLYMSGYTDDVIVHHGVLVDRERLLAKPFRPIDLLTRVREVLDR